MFGPAVVFVTAGPFSLIFAHLTFLNLQKRQFMPICNFKQKLYSNKRLSTAR